MTSLAPLVRIALLLFVAEAATSGDSTAGDWPTFRGPQRTAVSSETGLLQSWPEGGPKLLWETNGAGRGYASLAVAGSFIVKIVGSYTNIVGLPLYETAALLSGEGFPIHFGWLNAV